MRIQLRYFASVREALGTAQEELSLPAEVLTLGDLRRHLCQRGGAWAEALAEGRNLRVALNHQMQDETMPLVANAEVAFFPPVTGG